MCNRYELHYQQDAQFQQLIELGWILPFTNYNVCPMQPVPVVRSSDGQRAGALLHDIHNTGNNPHRMPAILAREAQEVWLKGSPEEARAVLTPYPADLMAAWRVSARELPEEQRAGTDPV
jgi:putative SOS response-associated peptidase YedK